KIRLSTELFRTYRPYPRHHLRPNDLALGILSAQKIPSLPSTHSFQGHLVWKESGLSHQFVRRPGSNHLCAVQISLAGRIVFQMDQTASAYPEVLWDIRERRESANLGCRVRIPAGGHCQKAAQSVCLALHFSTDFFGYPIR